MYRGDGHCLAEMVAVYRGWSLSGRSGGCIEGMSGRSGGCIEEEVVK